MAIHGAYKMKRPYLVLLINHFYKVKFPPKTKAIYLKEVFSKSYTDSTVASVVGDEALVVVGNVASVSGDLDVD